MTYNKADTPYHKAATKILKMIPDVFKELAAIETSHLRYHQQKLEQMQQESRTQQNGDVEAHTRPAVNGVSVETRQQLLDLGLEPPALLMSLLRDYSAMDEEQQGEIRQQAYGSHPMPPIVHVKAEEEGQSEEAEQQTAAGRKRQATPIINLMEDFVCEVYVPPPPPPPAPESPPSAKAQGSSKQVSTAAAQKPTAPKAPRKRKASDTPAREPVERRSTRRSIAAAEAELPAEVSAIHEVTEPATEQVSTPVAHARNKRQRAHTSAAATGSPLPEFTTDADSAAGAKPGSTPMSKSRSQPAANSQEGVQVKKDVGAHDSFLLFNSGWCYLKAQSAIAIARRGQR